MTIRETEIAGAIRALRECFHRLRSYGDDLHADLGVNASMRGVLESLAEKGPLTVPQVARAKGVSRQHIQVVVNALDGKGLVVIAANPRDARSPLVSLTKAGEALFRAVLIREKKILSAFAQQFTASDITVTRRTLDAFREKLEALSSTRSVASL